MGLMRTVSFASTVVVLLAASASADTPPPAPEPADTWECQLADGNTIYTNKERAGCRAVLLRPLSVVPSLENMPITPRASTLAAPHHDMPAYQDRGASVGGRNVPDWAKDWYASVAPSGSVHEEVCSLYSEWLHLVQKTRGGMFYGSDPSYGGDISGRNQRGASYSFNDNTRYVTLSRVFGAGFVPIGCP
ncbi:MAG: hypothetical protein HP497_10885 [Nitrospira sp.]|nr:hypothetical protein [Nitrospira sp.]